MGTEGFLSAFSIAQAVADIFSASEKKKMEGLMVSVSTATEYSSRYYCYDSKACTLCALQVVALLGHLRRLARTHLHSPCPCMLI